MIHIRKLIEKIVEDELLGVLERVDEKKTEDFVKIILKSKRIFLTGSGRSGFVANAFAMRLVQLGLKVYVVGESATPAVEKRDLLIVVSGSGETKIIEDITKESKNLGVSVCLITANKNSKISKLSDLVIEIKAKTKANHEKSIEPLGTLFEQSALIYLDAVVLLLMKKLGKDEKIMKTKHPKNL